MSLFNHFLERGSPRQVTLVGYGDFDIDVEPSIQGQALAAVVGAITGPDREHYCEARLVPLGLPEDARIAVEIEGERVGYLPEDVAHRLQAWLDGLSGRVVPRCIALIVPSDRQGVPESNRLDVKLDISMPPQIVRDGSLSVPVPERLGDAHP